MTMVTGPSSRARARWLVGGTILACTLLAVFPEGAPRLAGSAEEAEPKTNRMVCGECPEGYATTGMTSAPSICKEDDPTLVQCVPLGSRLLAVCGECPDGYRTIGSSLVPSRCGSKDSGLMSQCQLEESESSFLDPSQEDVSCPPNCAGKARKASQGALPPVLKYPSLATDKQ